MMSRSIFVALTFVLLGAPSLHAGVEVAPRRPVVASYLAGRPAIAFAGDRFLTVWQLSDEAGAHFVGAFSDRNGRRISEVAFPLLAFSSGSWMELLAVERGFVLFWGGRSDNEAHMAELDESGAVTARRPLRLPPHSTAKVAWNGRHFLLATQLSTFSRDGDVTAVLLDRAGNTVGEPHFLGPPFWPRLAVSAAGDGFVVAVPVGNGVEVHHIASDGTRTVQRARSGRAGTSTAALDVGGGNVLVVWRASTADGRSVLESSIFAPDGTASAIRTLTLTGQVSAGPHTITREGAMYRVWMDAYYFSDNATREATWSVVLDPTRDTVAPPAADFLRGSSSRDVRVAAGNGIVVLASSSYSPPFRSTVTTSAFTESGALLHEDVVSRMPVPQVEPNIVSGANGFLTAWTESAQRGSSTRAALLDRTGAPGTIIDVAPGTVLPSGIAWNGVDYLVVSSIDDVLLASRITADGRLLDRTPIIVASGARPRAAAVWSGARWVIAWIGVDNKMYSAAVMTSGAVAPSRELSFNIATPAGWKRTPAELTLTSDDRQLLLVWRDALTPPCLQPPCVASGVVYAARLDVGGAPIDLDPLHVFSNAQRIAVASSGREFLVLTHGSEDVATTAVRVEGAGLRASAPQSLFAFPGTILGDIAWDGGDYVVALRYSAPGRPGTFPHHLALRRVNQQGVEVAIPRGVNVGAGASPPAIAGAAAGTVIVLQETRPADAARVVAYRDGDFKPLPPLPSAPRNVTAIRRNDHVQVSWEASGGDPDGYVVEVLIRQHYLAAYSTIVAGHLRTARVDASKGNVEEVRVRALNASGVGPSTLPVGAAPIPRRRSTGR